MTDSHGRIYRCSNCGAPLAHDKSKQGLIRCLFCGVDNEIVREQSATSAQVRGHTRMSTLVLPYIFGPLIGFTSILVLRDFVGSPYFGRPALFVAFLFVVLGLAGLRIPASLGLLIIGASNIAKAFLFPVPGDYFEAKRFTSETGFEYLLPGVAFCFVGLLFFASIRLVSLGPSVRALKIRPGVVVLTLLAAGYSYFSLGQSYVKYAEQFQEQLTHVVAMTESACYAQMAEDLDQELQPLPSYTRAIDDDGSTTVLFASCASLSSFRKKDPLHVDSLHHHRAVASGASRQYFRSVEAHQKTGLDRLKKALYAIAYLENEESFSMVLVDLRSEKVVRKFLIPKAQDYDSKMIALWGALREATGGRFPNVAAKGSLASPNSKVKRTTTSFLAKPIRPSLDAEFIFHSQQAGPGNKTWLYGYAYNKSDIPAGQGEITVIHYISGSESVTSKGRTFGPMNPNEPTLVAIPVSFDISESTAFEVRVQALGAQVFSDGLRVSGLTKSTIGQKIMQVEGEVENSSVDAQSVRVQIVFFDANEKLVFAHPALLDQTSIPKEGRSHFKMLANWPAGITFSRIEAVVIGIEQ